MFRLALSILLTFTCHFVYSQITFKGCIVAEGNNYGAPGNFVKMAHYYPIEKKYVYFDSLPGDFTNVVLCDGAYTYIHVGNANAVRDSFYKYDSDCKSRLASAQCPGLQKMKIVNNKIIASKGYGADSNYIEIFDKNTLVKLAEISEVDKMCNGVSINANMAYVTVNGSWPSYTDTGTIAVIDMGTNSFVKFIYLDTNAKVVNQVFSNGNKLYCIADFNKIVEYDLLADTFSTVYTGTIRGVEGLYGANLYFHSNTDINAFNVITHTTLLVPSYMGLVSEFKIDQYNNNKHFVIFNDYTNGYAIFKSSLPQTIIQDSFIIGVASVLDTWIDSNIAPINTSYYVNIEDDNDTSFTLGVSDVDNCERLKSTIITGPLRIGAIATIDSMNTIHYTPASGLVANDTITYITQDIAGAADTATIYIHVYDLLNIENPENVNIAIYPNPFIDQLHIQGAVNIESIDVYDIKGALHFHETPALSNIIINTASFESGMYIIKLRLNSGHTISSKLIK